MMIRSQLRQIARHGDRVSLGLLPTTRHFSASRAVAEGQGQDQPSGPNPSTQGPASTPAREPRTSNKPPGNRPPGNRPTGDRPSGNRPPGSRPTGDRPPGNRPPGNRTPENRPPGDRPSGNRPPGAGPPRRPRPAGAVDARSFAAPRAGDQPKIIRRPRLQVTRGGKPGKGKPVKKARGPRAPRPKRAEIDVNDEVQAAAIKQIEHDQIMQTRPKPVRYEPSEVDFSTLRETWPSLPTDANGRSAAVLEKLAILAARFPNGYVPPHELARRLWKGQNVLFANEAEKAEAMEEVQQLSRARADKISLKKGELVEPREIKFGALGEKETATLLETYVQGKYPTAEAGKDQPAALGEIVKNLRNNGTYQTAGKRPQFLAKVESLLASGRAKRT